MILASILFLLFILTSIFAFPGGNLIDSNSTHYNFFYNYISELGNSITITGKDNTASKIFFITAFASYGLVLIYYSRIWRAIGTEAENLKFFGFTSKFSMIISGLAFIGIAFTPWNSLLYEHIFYFEVMLAAFALWIIMILILQNTNDKFKKLFFYNILNLIVILIYLFIILNYNKAETESDYEFYAISQMAVILSIPVNLFLQSAGIMHFLKTSDFRRSGIRDFYV